MSDDSKSAMSPLLRRVTNAFQQKEDKENKKDHVQIEMDSPSVDDASRKRIIFKKKRLQSVRELYEKPGDNAIGRQYSDDLLKAVEKNDCDECKRLLENGKDVNIKDEKTEMVALHIAAKNGYDEILHLLLQRDADCNAQDRTSQTPLHLAATKGHFYCCIQLLKHADLKVNASDKYGDTALHLAAKEGRREICNEILNHKDTNINHKNKKVMTPLHLAAQEGHDSVLQLLIRRDAKWNLTDANRHLPLHYAAERGFPECCRELMSLDSNAKEKQLKATIKDGKTPVILAAKSGHHKCCQELGSTNVNGKDKEGNSALFYAALGGFENTVSILIGLGADLNIRNKYEIAPIHEASKKQKSGPLHSLIEKGADWSVRDEENKTVLHFAAEANATECLKYLLDISYVRTLLDGKDNKGCTPLHLAIKYGGVECADILLENGASAVEQCDGGMIPLHIAAGRGYTSICKILLTNHIEQVSQENDTKATPLHLAAIHGSTDVCELLLRKGARLKAVDKNGRTALHVASLHGQTNMVKLLIKKSIPQQAKDDTGSTALHLAACKGKLECCKAIVAGAKASSWEVDHNDNLPLDRAFEEKYDEVFSFLLLQMYFDERQEERMKRMMCLHDYMHTSLEDKRIVAAEAIIDSPWWKASLLSKDDHHCPNFRFLVKEHPDLALKVQNRCIHQDTGAQDPKVTYDFRFIEDNYYVPSDSKDELYDPKTGKLHPKACKFNKCGLPWKQMHPLTCMINHNRPQLVKHPLVNAWLIHKWRTYIVKVFLALLVLEIIFNVCLVVFMARIQNWNHIYSTYNLERDQFCNVTMEQTRLIENATKSEENIQEKHNAWIALVTVTIFVLLLELNSICRLKEEYVTGSSPLQISRTILILVILIPCSTCNFHSMVLEVLQWQAGIITLLFSWLLLINILNQLPVLSVFMPITQKFLTSFFKVVFYIIMLIFAFAFIFHLLLQNQAAFRTVEQAMVKTIVWMLGDLAYDDTFLIDDDPDITLLYPVMVNILFVIFVTTISGFIVNLIITQPSDKLEAYRDRASFHMAANRVDLILKLDVCFPFFQRWTLGILTDHGETKVISNKIINYLTEKLLSLSKLDTQEDAAEPQMQILLAKLEAQSRMFRQLLAEQKNEIRGLKKQLELIAK